MLLERLRDITWSRPKLELLSAVLIVLFGTTVLLVPIKQQSSLSYDKGQIVYTGEVVNHRMNGQGKLTFANGDTYEGQFKNGVFSGKGLFKAQTGWSYEGEFRKGQPHGQGKLIAKDKKVYEGQFKQGIYQK